MKGTGKTICNMGMERKSGPITQGMRESILKARNMEGDVMSGQMEASMMETGLKIE